jgi:hypothetical protein
MLLLLYQKNCYPLSLKSSYQVFSFSSSEFSATSWENFFFSVEKEVRIEIGGWLFVFDSENWERLKPSQNTYK